MNAQYKATLHEYQGMVDSALLDIQKNNIISRIWKGDHTVWNPDPTEISNRLSWLLLPETMIKSLPEIQAFVEEVQKAGYTHAVLLGMGGSSLAPKFFAETFGCKEHYLTLHVLDSTSPDAIAAVERNIDYAKTLFIVSTKSGGTVETFSFFKYFYHQYLNIEGTENAGKHFIAITDPQSTLEEIAHEYHFRKTFLNDPNIGGRYSALSHFGLVPAALLGVDIEKILACAKDIAEDSQNEPNNSETFGAAMGVLALEGRDKLTVIASPPLKHFGAWAEQLLAESTGKEGKGIIPVDEQAPGDPSDYANDRLFVYLKINGDMTYDKKVQALAESNQPVIVIVVQDIYDLGGEFFRWEFATALAGARLGINPFDQPNVESAKNLARKMVATFEKDGTLPSPKPTFEEDSIKVYTDNSASSIKDALKIFLSSISEGNTSGQSRSYVMFQAYISQDAASDTILHKMQNEVRDTFKVATMIGYGPSFLHSTGQLHKGDSGNGLFIQITGEAITDIPIPNSASSDTSSISFGTLIEAQSLGDREALLDAKRKVIRFDLGKDVLSGLNKLQESLSSVIASL